jgi:hypothetical protein
VVDLGEEQGALLVKVPLERRFPGLTRTNWRQTSEATEQYNCIAWALRYSDRFAWPRPEGDPPGWWPDHLPCDETRVDTFLALFESEGFVPCRDGNLEPDYEKVALFVGLDRRLKHAARQTRDGWWTHKLGDEEDLETEEVDGLDDPLYFGRPRYFMKRKRT